MKKLDTEPKKREALKANISIRVKGFGWKEHHITWTKNRKNRPIKELAAHLRKIIRLEAGLKIPKEPPTNVLTRREVPVLGTMTDERRQLDEKSKKDEEALRTVVKMMKRERKVRGDENSIYDAFQPFEAPELSELVKKRIDICWPLDTKVGDDKTTEKVWCQGTVKNIVSLKDQTVTVLWDAMLDVEGFEVATEGVCTLDRDKWRKTTSYGWRKDLDVELFENYYAEDDEGVVEEEDDDEEGVLFMKEVVMKMTMKCQSETKPMNNASKMSNIAGKYCIFETFKSVILF